jgi:hypothetical protein
MALPQFAVYQSATTSTLTDNGSVREQMTDNGWAELVPSNFKREYKVVDGVEKYNRVLVLVFNGQIDPLTKKNVNIQLTCSEPLSRELRANPELITTIADNHIFENENGYNFIGMVSEGNIKIGASEFKTSTVKVTRTGLEKLIAL